MKNETAKLADKIEKVKRDLEKSRGKIRDLISELDDLNTANDEAIGCLETAADVLGQYV